LSILTKGLLEILPSQRCETPQMTTR